MCLQTRVLSWERKGENVRLYWKPVFPLFLLFVGVIAGCKAPEPGISPNAGGRNLVLTIDCSGSMEQSDPDLFRIEASHLAVSLAEETDNVGIIRFCDKAQIVTSLQSARVIAELPFQQALETELSKASGQTNFVEALEMTAAMLERNPTGEPCVIFVSDGEHNVGSKRKVYDALEPFEQNEWPIYTVALTKEAESELLRDMARNTGGAYLYARDADDLFKHIQELATAFWGYSVHDKPETPFLVLGMKELHFLGLRNRGMPSIAKIEHDGKLIPAETFSCYPSPGRKYARPLHFDMWSLEYPGSGTYKATRKNQGKVAGVFGKPEFQVDYASRDQDPKGKYDVGDAIAIRLRVKGNSDMLAQLQQKAKGIALFCAGEQILETVALAPKQEGADLVYEGQSIVKDAGTLTVRPLLSIGEWQHKVLPRDVKVNEKPAWIKIAGPEKVPDDEIKAGGELPFTVSVSGRNFAGTKLTLKSQNVWYEGKGDRVPAQMRVIWQETRQDTIVCKGKDRDYIALLRPPEAKPGTYKGECVVSVTPVVTNLSIAKEPPQYHFSFSIREPKIEIRTKTLDFGTFEVGEHHRQALVEMAVSDVEGAILKIKRVSAEKIPAMINAKWVKSNADTVEVGEGTQNYFIRLQVTERECGGPYTGILEMTVETDKVELVPDPCEIPFTFKVAYLKTVSVEPSEVRVGAVKAGSPSGLSSLQVSTKSEEPLAIGIEVKEFAGEGEKAVIEGLPTEAFPVSSAKPHTLRFCVRPDEKSIGEKELTLILKIGQEERVTVPVFLLVIPKVTSTPLEADLGMATWKSNIGSAKVKITNYSKERTQLELVKSTLRGQKTQENIPIEDIGLSEPALSLAPGESKTVTVRVRASEILPDDTYWGKVSIMWDGYEASMFSTIIHVKRGSEKQ